MELEFNTVFIARCFGVRYASAFYGRGLFDLHADRRTSPVH